MFWRHDISLNIEIYTRRYVWNFGHITNYFPCMQSTAWHFSAFVELFYQKGVKETFKLQGMACCYVDRSYDVLDGAWTITVSRCYNQRYTSVELITPWSRILINHISKDLKQRQQSVQGLVMRPIAGSPQPRVNLKQIHLFVWRGRSIRNIDLLFVVSTLYLHNQWNVFHHEFRTCHNPSE